MNLFRVGALLPQLTQEAAVPLSHTCFGLPPAVLLLNSAKRPESRCDFVSWFIFHWPPYHYHPVLQALTLVSGDCKFSCECRGGRGKEKEGNRISLCLNFCMLFCKNIIGVLINYFMLFVTPIIIWRSKFENQLCGIDRKKSSVIAQEPALWQHK